MTSTSSSERRSRARWFLAGLCLVALGIPACTDGSSGSAPGATSADEVGLQAGAASRSILPTVDGERAFLDDASHQLRTHLTTMRMQVDYALRESHPEQLQETVAALATELQRAARSTNQLLALARSDAAPLNQAWFDAHEMLVEVAREFLPAMRAKGLDLGVEGDAVQVHGDRLLLREAIANLLANAIAHVPAGSVTLSAAADDAGFSLHVVDTGPGLPADLQSAAGTRFLRRRGVPGEGSGLGLAIVRAVVERHGGRLLLRAGPGGSGLHASLHWPRSAATLQGE